MDHKIAQKYFWDVDFKKLDFKKSSSFVIERILEYGDKEAISWLLHHYNKKDVVNILNSSRRISNWSRSYWSLVL